jgi:hypothetical protein
VRQAAGKSGACTRFESAGSASHAPGRWVLNVENGSDSAISARGEVGDIQRGLALVFGQARFGGGCFSIKRVVTLPLALIPTSARLNLPQQLADLV